MGDKSHADVRLMGLREAMKCGKSHNDFLSYLGSQNEWIFKVYKDKNVDMDFDMVFRTWEEIGIRCEGVPGDKGIFREIDRLKNVYEKYESSSYYELFTYFYDTGMPSGYILGDNKYDRSKIEKAGTLGTISADDWAKSLWHFYNPVTDKGLKEVINMKNAIENSRLFWNGAIEASNRGDLTAAYESLGVVLHIRQLKYLI